MGILDDIQQPRCSNCIWWHPASGGATGECRHRSPVGIFDTNTGDTYGKWPLTDATDTCGDHQYRGTSD
jgi:hypothetical protein